jgi:hypothetical protein
LLLLLLSLLVVIVVIEDKDEDDVVDCLSVMGTEAGTAEEEVTVVEREERRRVVEEETVTVDGSVAEDVVATDAIVLEEDGRREEEAIALQGRAAYVKDAFLTGLPRAVRSLPEEDDGFGWANFEEEREIEGSLDDDATGGRSPDAALAAAAASASWVQLWSSAESLEMAKRGESAGQSLGKQIQGARRELTTAVPALAPK